MAKEVMMSMRMAPEAGAALSNHHAPPPVPQVAAESYSSNYKGVMLCDRPGIEVSRDAGGGGGAGMKDIPFLSAVNAPEQLGLNPIAKEHLGSSKGRTKPKNTVLSNHKRWLHSLQMLKRQLAVEEDYLANEEEAKKKRLADESKKVRDHIRQIKSDMVGAADVDGPHAQSTALNQESMLSELKGKFGRGVVQEVLERTAGAQGNHEAENSGITAPASAPAGETMETTRPRGGTAKTAKNKPAWARTEEDNEEAEEDEMEDLLEFAESLDIDKYMDDYEFSEALAAAKARITEMDDGEEADGGNSDDCRTVGTNMSGGSTMSQRLHEKAAKEASGNAEWDNRTEASDVSGRSQLSTKSRAVAQEMLDMNPNLRKIHNTKSLATIVENMEDSKFDPADQNKFGRCGMGAVKVAIHNDEDRLHRLDIKEGKDLPYLYRNPAV